MSDFVNSVPEEPPPETTSVQQPSSADPTTAGHAAQANKTSPKDFDLSTGVASVGDLRKEAPEVFKKMMEGIAMNIVGKMRKSQERLKKMWREGNE